MANPIPLSALTTLILSMFIQGCSQQDSSSVGVVQINPNAAASVRSPDTARHAAMLAAALGKPTQLLVGLGSASLESIQAQGLKPDIYDQYINGVGPNSWINWNSPTGAYIGVVTQNADALGAIPMFTLYQMAALGDKNISGLSDRVFMRQYWDNVRVLFRELNTYNKPVLVNFEPDFWGYAQRAYADPTQHFVEVNSVNPDCMNQPNDMTGLGHCLIAMARNMATQAYIGFPPSLFSDVASTEMSYLKQVGAGKADFVVMQTGDRDAGCFEARYVGDSAGCVRSDGPTHTWDASNATRPNFTSHFALARKHFDYFQRPILWWQTPMGVPSTTPGGRPGEFRDNKMDYFLNHPAEIVAAGGIGVVFSPGHTSQTSLDTDRGQFKQLSELYFKNPAQLP